MTDNPQWREPGKDRCPITNKEKHPTKDAAKGHRAHIIGRNGKANGRTNVYRCDWCDTWHVGRR